MVVYFINLIFDSNSFSPYLRGIALARNIISGIPEFLDSGRKSWTLDSGRWTLDAGLWTLDSGHWTLDAGLWTLDAGLWTLDATLRKLSSGH